MNTHRMAQLIIAVLTAMTLIVVTAAPAGAYPGVFDNNLALVEFDQSGDLHPIPLVCGTDERIFWYGKGTIADELWTDLVGSLPLMGYTSVSKSVGGDYMPINGDFNGDGCTDIFWYSPGPSADYVWTFAVDGSHVSDPTSVNGTYQPIVGEYSGDPRSDIYWYAPGAGMETIWTGTATEGMFTSSAAPQVSGTYQARGIFGTYVLWYAPGSAADYLTRPEAGSNAPISSYATAINGTYQLRNVGFFPLLYAPGPSTDYLVNTVVAGPPGFVILDTISGALNSTFRVGSHPVNAATVLYNPTGRDYLMVPPSGGPPPP